MRPHLSPCQVVAVLNSLLDEYPETVSWWAVGLAGGAGPMTACRMRRWRRRRSPPAPSPSSDRSAPKKEADPLTPSERSAVKNEAEGEDD